jgi:hypothetical protein
MFHRAAAMIAKSGGSFGKLKEPSAVIVAQASS